MKLYASTIISGSEGWGDGVPVLWFCEYLYSKDKNCLIDLYAGGNSMTGCSFQQWLWFSVKGKVSEYLSFRGANNETREIKSGDHRILERSEMIIKYMRNKVFHHANFIKKPEYIHSWLFSRPNTLKYDQVLITHHLHSQSSDSWASPSRRDDAHGGLLPPMKLPPKIKSLLPKLLYMDLNSTILNSLCKEGFVPTFPMLHQKLEEEYQSLPPEFIAIQLRKDDTGPLGEMSPKRNNLNGQEYHKWAMSFLKDCYLKWRLPLVITSEFIPVNGIDLFDATKFNLWTKIAIHARAKYSYVAHSGFGMIAAGYRGMHNIKLINPSPDGWCRNPPALLFSNVHDPNPPQVYTASPPGWIDQAKDWKIDFEDSLRP